MGVVAWALPGASTCETCTSWLDSLAGPGLSLPAASIATEPSSATVAASGLATGGSLTSVTVTETVPVSLRGSGEPLVVPLSGAEEQTAAGPSQRPSGRQRIFAASGPELMIVALPWAGASTCETCTCWLASLAGPGLSLSLHAALPISSSATVAASGLATGGSLTSVTVTETVPVSLRGSGEPLVVPLS